MNYHHNCKFALTTLLVLGRLSPTYVWWQDHQRTLCEAATIDTIVENIVTEYKISLRRLAAFQKESYLVHGECQNYRFTVEYRRVERYVYMYIYMVGQASVKSSTSTFNDGKMAMNHCF